MHGMKSSGVFRNKQKKKEKTLIKIGSVLQNS